MADAGAGGDAGDRGILDAAVDEASTAPGNQQVHEARCGHQSSGTFPAGVLDQVHGIFGDAEAFQTGAQGIYDGICAAEGFLAAPEDAGAAALRFPPA